jgi:hypothetical protein
MGAGVTKPAMMAAVVLLALAAGAWWSRRTAPRTATGPRLKHSDVWPHEGAFSAAAFNSADFVPVNGLGGSSGFVTL